MAQCDCELRIHEKIYENERIGVKDKRSQSTNFAETTHENNYF